MALLCIRVKDLLFLPVFVEAIPPADVARSLTYLSTASGSDGEASVRHFHTDRVWHWAAATGRAVSDCSWVFRADCTVVICPA